MKILVRVQNFALLFERQNASLIGQGMYPIGGAPEKLAARMKSDYDKWGAMIKKLNLKLE